MQGVALAARDAAQAKGLSLKVQLPEEPVFVVADGSRIDQVLTNLVVNSIRYTSAGSVLLRLHPYDEATRRLHFTVADTGPGIPAALLPKLLEPDTLETGRSRRGEGSGIGLAVVRTLVDLMGGIVSVSSREGEGTTFDVHIPAELIDADQPAPAPGMENGRVLIVDDREDVLEALTSVDQRLGLPMRSGRDHRRWPRVCWRNAATMRCCSTSRCRARMARSSRRRRAPDKA